MVFSARMKNPVQKSKEHATETRIAYLGWQRHGPIFAALLSGAVLCGSNRPENPGSPITKPPKP